MPEKDNPGMGERIQSMVEDAINSMDFEQLNKNITGSIQSVFEELNIQPSKGTNRKKDDSSNVRYHYGTDTRSGSREVSRFVKNPPGTVTGPLCTAVGGIFTGIFGIASIVMAAVQSAIPSAGLILAGRITLSITIPLTIASAVVLFKGISLSGRVKRFRRYTKLIGQRTYCQVKELAAAVGKNEKFVVRDIQKLIENKAFTNGHLDAQNTCLMLDDAVYRQYLDAQEAYRQRTLEEQKRRKEDQAVFSSEGIDNPELVRTIEEGNRYIEAVRRANDAIPGEEISEKLYRLEALIRKIFEILKQKPEQLPKLRKFMNYYMPTTLKLVQTYQELDAQPASGENIQQSKTEIEKTLDTINLAYEKLLDSFFEDAAMDIKSDITVLETMLAQEGLTKNPFDTESGSEHR